MTSKAELESNIRNTFVEQWKMSEGRTVPATIDIPMNNTARRFELATFLYADLDGSTRMVSALSWQRCAEIYKAYLYCASRMIRDHAGEVVAFDGDRVMGIFLGDMQSSNAVKCAMRINWILNELINPLFRNQYNDSYSIGHTIGIDVSETRCCRTGVRGDNDLVWVGSAANIAAKLTGLTEYPIWITNTVFNSLADWAKVGRDGRQMWEGRTWTAMNDRLIYRSNWWWSID